MSIGLKGLYTPPAPETRDIAYLEVVHNGQTYDWMVYVPQGQDIGNVLVSMESKIYADIDYKEAQWVALEPKTKSFLNPITSQEETIPIAKEEIVKPDNPDYYALRRNEYPSLGDQLGAIAKGLDSDEYQEILTKISEIKTKYPKI